MKRCEFAAKLGGYLLTNRNCRFTFPASAEARPGGAWAFLGQSGRQIRGCCSTRRLVCPVFARSTRVVAFVLAVLAAAVTVPAAIAAPSLPSYAHVNLNMSTVLVTGGPPPGAVLPSNLQHGCQFNSGYTPTIIVAANGNISGGCNWYVPAGPFRPFNETWTGSYSGTMNTTTGQVTLSHATQHHLFDPVTGKTETYNITFNGTSTAHNNFGGSGPASFTYARTCVPGTSVCSAASNMSYSGTITSFTFGLDGPVTGVDVEVDHIEVVQVVQTAMNTVPLVADKTTIARVFFSTPLEAPITSVTLKARRNGILLGDQPTQLPGGATVARDYDSLRSEDQSVNFRLPMSWVTAGATELEAVLVHGGPPDPNAANNTRLENVTFQTRRPMTLEYIEVCLEDLLEAICDYPIPAVKPPGFETFFPLPNGGLIYRRVPVGSFIVSDDTFSTDERADRALATLGKWQTLRKLRNPATAGDQVIGWTPEHQLFVGSADTRFAGGSGAAAFVTWDHDQLRYDTLIHEIAHNLGARHVATPDSCGSADPDSDWPYGNARIQEPGWDVRTDNVIPPTTYDFMSYCNTAARGMSPFTYTKLFNANSEPAAGLAPQAFTNYVVASGTAKADSSSGTIDPILHSISAATFPPSDPTGTHCIRINDTSAADYCFHMSFEGENGQPLSEAAFVIATPFTGIISSLKLCEAPCGPSDTVAMLTGSANWPFAEFAPVAPGALAGPNATISWSGTDADPGTTLTYTLFQSIDGAQNFTPILVDTTATSFTFDAREIQQGTSYFQLFVSDGLKNNTANLGPVTVGTPRPWGDQTCDGELDLADTLAIRRAIAGLSRAAATPRGCPQTGNPASLDVMPASFAAIGITWGDLDCTGGVAANDVLALLRKMAGLPVAPGNGQCPDIGEPVYVSE